MIVTRGLGSNLLVTQGYGGVEIQIALVYPFCPRVSPYALTASPLIIGGTGEFTSNQRYISQDSPFSRLSGQYFPLQSVFSKNSQFTKRDSFTKTNSSYTLRDSFSRDIEKCAGV